MKTQHIPWTSSITAVATLIALACLAVSVGGTGTQGSHSHMRQHQHSPGQSHRHHVPKRQQLPSEGEQRQDPKRLPREEWSNPQLLHDNDLFHDREHLKEELPEYLNLEKVQEMSDRELDYHYFRMHDFDQNLLLDGLELLAAIGHVIGEEEEEEGEEGGGGPEKEAERRRIQELQGLSEEEKIVVRNYRYDKWEEDWKFYIELVDGVLENNDLNKDGYLSWSEFLNGRNRDI